MRTNAYSLRTRKRALYKPLKSDAPHLGPPYSLFTRSQNLVRNNSCKRCRWALDFLQVHIHDYTSSNSNPLSHYRTLLVMFCVLKFYFVDFYGMFTSSPTWHLKKHVLCKVGKNIIFQNKTLGLLVSQLVMFYRHIKHFGTNFVFQTFSESRK